MEEFKIELDLKQIKERVNAVIDKAVVDALGKSKTDLEDTIKKYFASPYFGNKISQFESAFDWAVEAAFREGVQKAMEELNLKELVASKTKEILSENNFITELAEAKVRASLGLPPKNNDPNSI